jgi:hypothetical protein
MFHAQRFTPALLSITIILVSFNAASVSADDANQLQPYNVFVAESQAYTRCGPSAKYYRTDPLKHGQQLEVYAETDDGWLGVRPPQDSFCWIPADTVELDGSGEMGDVIEDRTVAWIGTHLGRARKYLWQVQLAEGETVTVIGRQERDGPDGPQLWLRIVPPSGEFRWIHQNQTVRTSEELVESIAGQNELIAKADVQFQPAGRTHVDPQPKTAKLASATKPEPAASRRRVHADAAAVTASGDSVMIGSVGERPIGSGVQSFDNDTIDLPPSLETSAGLIAKPRRNNTNRPKPRGLLASMAKLGQPRIREIGEKDPGVDRTATTSSLNDSQTASDDNWVSGAASRMSQNSDSIAINAAPMTLPARNTTGISNDTFVQSHQSSNEIAQVAGISPLPAQTLVPAKPLSNTLGSSLAPATVSPQLRSPTFVSADNITRLQQRLRGTDVNSMRLVLSQLMSSQSSAAEARVVSQASRSLAATSTDPAVADAARVLARRADQYAGLADRRDGPSVIQTNGQPSPESVGFQPLPSSAVAFPGSGLETAGSLPPSTQPETNKTSYTGQLVQVYSARTHSPPFALTDGTGRTIAYVTPSPGINLRMHLNQQVTVTGTPGFVSGLNMPHLMAQRADR